MKENTPKLLIIDSNSLVNRAFYALPPLMLESGLYTNAIFGYLSMLQSIILREKPTHICAVFDCHAKTFRHLMYDGYKATRRPMPEELAQQIPVLKEILTSMGIKIVAIEGFEADDIIGTASKLFDIDSLVITGDRDCLQLLDSRTKIGLYVTKRGGTEIVPYDVATLKEKEGLEPYQIIEYKGLAGDSSDNIPGAAGIGEKTAKQLLSSYGDIDNVYRNIDSVSPKVREKLINSRDNVYLSRKLATIDRKVKIDCELKEFTFEYPLPQGAREIMNKYRLKRIVEKFEFSGAENAEFVPQEEEIEENVASEDIEKSEELKAAVEILKNSEKTAFYFADDKVYISAPGHNYTVTFGTLLNNDLQIEDLIEAISPLLTDKRKKLFFDVKKIRHMLKEFEADVAEPYDDVLLKAYLTNPSYNYSSLPDILTGFGIKEANYAYGMLKLDKKLNEKLEFYKLNNLYRDIELPLTSCLYEMETCGIGVDETVLDELDTLYKTRLEGILDDIYEIAGEKFNVNSNKQLSVILFEKLNLPHKQKNKRGDYSVSADILEELDHPIVAKLLQYRRLTKLTSTYIDGLRPYIKRDKKIHSCFNQTQTATGRLSSSEPNLQNIPVRHSEGKEIRKIFIPSEDCVLLSADYSQIELRLLAHFSMDEHLVAAFNQGEDIHSLTASKLYNVPLDEVTAPMRSSAKAVNFGIIYGISSFGLAKNASVSNGTAKKFIEDYFNAYPNVKIYMNKNVEDAKEKGYLRTLMGRIRFFPELKASQFSVRSFGQRAAMNMPLQGSASDIIKLAMLMVRDELKKRGLNSKIILQIHDELVLDVPYDEVEITKEIVKNCMENVCKLNVPLTVNVSTGKNLFEVK